MRLVLLAGLALGVLSRVDETTDGLTLLASENATWLGLAFLAGTPRRGAAALTAANASYYAWIAATEPGQDLDAVAGPVWWWVVLGLAAGAVLGALGRAARQGATRHRWGALGLGAVALAAAQTGLLDALLP